MERWEGRVAVVTGASKGIGRAIATALVINGMKVVGVARKIQPIQALASELHASGARGELHAASADLTKEEDIMTTVTWVKKTFGGIDVLVNNAGIVHVTPLTGAEGSIDITTKKWREVIDLNLLAGTIFTKEAVRNMRDRGCNDGHIVHIGSVLGTQIVEFPGGYFHSAVKHALSVLSEGLRRELRDLGTSIRVTNVNPGLVRTEWWSTSGEQKAVADEMYEKNPSLNPEDVADAVIFTLSAPPHVQIHQITVQPIGGGF